MRGNSALWTDRYLANGRVHEISLGNAEVVTLADGTYKILMDLKGDAKDSGKPVSDTLKLSVKGGANAASASPKSNPAIKACLADRHGKVQGVSFTGSEGKL